MYHLLHLLVLGEFPDSFRNGCRLRHDQHTGLDLEDMRVPELLLFLVERVIESWRDHVFFGLLVSIHVIEIRE
jgi:hypothetical protein